MVHTCAACKYEAKAKENPEKQDTGLAPNVPSNWFIRCIDDTDYVLCDVWCPEPF